MTTDRPSPHYTTNCWCAKGEHPQTVVKTARQARREATLDRTVDRLIAEENRAFLADPAAVAEAKADGERYRQRGEAEGWLPSAEGHNIIESACRIYRAGVGPGSL